MKFEEKRLKQVLSNTLGIEIDMIDDETSIDTVEEWDSVKHLNLVIAIESEFDMSFTEDETVEILSYSLIKAVLEEHRITFE